MGLKSILLAAAGAGVMAAIPCPSKLQAVYADMHDGDKKEVTINGASLQIKPSGNNQTWVVNAQLDADSCSAMIDFNVPGKPGPPPVALKATYWVSTSYAGRKSEFEFTDPSGTLAAKDAPLNRWVEQHYVHEGKVQCPRNLNHIYADIHDGDQKAVSIDRSTMTIQPHANNQKWIVKADLDAKTCTASIDFNVPGKPSPPPVKLQAALLYSYSVDAMKTMLEFTDPSGTLAKDDFPLNHWVQLGGTSATVISI